MTFSRSTLALSLLLLVLTAESFASGCPSIACIIGFPSCSPEVARGNLQAVDRTLGALADSHDFEADTKFRAQVDRVRGISDDAAKMSEYLKLIGLEALSAEEISHFVGARSVDPARVSAIRSSTSLSEVKAKIVVEAVRTAMLGGLL